MNNDYLNPSNGYLTSENINMIENNTTWYLGTVYSGYNYKLSKYTDASMTSTTTSTVAKVGLLRTGELMSGQYNRYAESSGNVTGLNVSYWLVTKYVNNFSSVLQDIGFISAIEPTTKEGIKPSLTLKSNVIITGGTGLKNDPFEIKLSS